MNNNKMNELIAVVKRATLFPDQIDWKGIRLQESDIYYAAVRDNVEYIPRGIAETNYAYKQIVSYFVFMYKERIFLMQRAGNASEKRLASCYTLGIGGHLRKTDVEKKSLYEWGIREFHEEVIYKDPFNIEFVGMINDDSTNVGKVHIGYLFLIH